MVYGRAIPLPRASRPHAKVVEAYAKELLEEAARLQDTFAPLASAAK